MKRKIFSILFALVLVLGFILATAVPAGANGAATLYERWNTGNIGGYGSNEFPYMAQTFTAVSNHTVNMVKLKFWRTGSPGLVTVSLRATDGSGHPAGPDLTSGSIGGNGLAIAPGAWYEIAFSIPYDLLYGNKYAIVVADPGADDGNRIDWCLDQAGGYGDGNIEWSAGGTSWNTISSFDFLFEVYGPPPTEVWVDDNFGPSTPGWGYDHFAKIQDGVNAVAGSTVNVAAGTYKVADESWNGKSCVYINKSITLSGAGSGLTILDAEHTYSVLHAPGPFQHHCTVVWNEAQNVTIEGLTVANGDYGIRNTTVDIGGGAQNSATFTDVVVTNNYGIGIVFENNITTATFTDCEANNSGDFGIYFTPTHAAGTVSLTDTSANNNGHIGFGCQGSIAHLSIVGGTFNSNTGGIFHCDYTTDLGPYYGFGIELQNCVGTLTGVTAQGNGGDGPAEGGAGINVKGASSNVTISTSTLTGNPIGLWLENWDGHQPAPAAVAINFSNLEGNDDYGVKNDCTGITVDATGNWWGSASGPSGEGPGTGDAVSDYVDYSPWWGANYIGVAHPWVWYTNDFIQEAINAASSGDTINVAAGTYDEQVVIDKPLTLQGVGDDTIIKPNLTPLDSDLALWFDVTWIEGYGVLPDRLTGIIVANNVAGVTVKDLKVDGGTVTNPRGSGWVASILYYGTSGVIDNVTSIDMTTSPTCRGYGFYLYAAGPGDPVNVEVKNCHISNYDKNGINVHEDRLRADIHDNEITGRGLVSDEVQNGIVVILDAQATVNDNTISNHAYNFPNADNYWLAMGINFCNAGGSAEGNILTNNQIGIAASILPAEPFGGYTQTVSMVGNTVSAPAAFPLIGLPVGVGLLAESYIEEATLNVTMDGNDLTSGGPNANAGIAIGWWMPESYGAGHGDIVATIENNTISNWQEGIRLRNCVAAGSTITGNTISNNDSTTSGIHIDTAVNADNVIVNFNNIEDNGPYGAYNGGTGILDATNNWWGYDSGPEDLVGTTEVPPYEGVSVADMMNADGEGDEVSENVDYCPWLGIQVTGGTSGSLGGGDTLDAKGEADIEVDVTGGGATVTVAEYSDNPGGGFSGGDIGKYVDVHITDATCTQIEIRLYYTQQELVDSGVAEASLTLYWWDGSSWHPCSDSGVDTTDIPGPPTYSGYMWARIRGDTFPNLTDLTGTPFGGAGTVGGGGGVPPTTLSKVGSVSLLPYLDLQGRTRVKIILRSDDGVLTITIFSETLAHNAEGNPLASMGIVTLSTPPPPPGYVLVGHAYDCLPDGANFAPKVTMTFAYDPADIPDGVNENDLLMAYWNGNEWVNLPTTIDAAANTATTESGHFTPFALLAYTGLANFNTSDLSITPATVDIGQEITITLSVANAGDTEGSYSVVLKINGTTAEEKSITLAAGESQNVSFSVTREEAGSYSVDVNGLTGSFTVAAPVSAAEAPPEAPAPIAWWIWVIAGAVVVGLITFFMVRRRAY